MNIDDEFKNKKILITGGCGSIGRVLIDRLLKYSPNVIRVFDINEKGLFDLRQKYVERKDIRYLLGNVSDKARIERACEDVDIVIHAAALKHVYFCEYNPFEALKTNVIGTQNVIDAALENNVKKVIYTSSDKAVNPSNVMGITKLLAERLIIAANMYRGSRDTIFSCLRFGNVFGSSGSVINLFYQQIINGGPVTITNPSMTRYIMNVDEATIFIINAIAYSQGSEIFIPKMRALTILDLANTMIEYYSPNNNIGIDIIGKMPGEKMYEEILTDSERIRTIENLNMYIVLPEIKELQKNDIDKYNIKKPDDVHLNSSDAPHMNKIEILSLIKEIIPG